MACNKRFTNRVTQSALGIRSPHFYQGGSKRGRRTFGIFYEGCYAILRVPLSVVVAQWVRRWTADHRVVELVGSNPLGDVFQIRFSNCFYLSFMLGQVNLSDIAIPCYNPNNCCQQNFKCFDEPLFSLGLFS